MPNGDSCAQLFGSDESTLASPPSTPRQREWEVTDLSEEVKARVDWATSALTGSRCLIENADDDCVDYVHIVKQSTPSDILNCLELAWNMPPATLNINTRQNILRLSPQFHALFDDDSHWMLVPEVHILKAYLDTCDKPPSQFPIINDTVYKYTIFAHNNMKPLTIRRCATSTGLSQGAATPAFTDHTYPFTEFGPLFSHIHPRFVIADSGRKMCYQMTSFRATSMVPTKVKFMIMSIYMNWTTRTHSFSGSSDGYDYETNQSDSEHTPEARPYPYHNPLQDDTPLFRNKTHARATGDDSARITAYYDNKAKMLSIQTWALDVHHFQDANIV